IRFVQRSGEAEQLQQSLQIDLMRRHEACPPGADFVSCNERLARRCKPLAKCLLEPLALLRTRHDRALQCGEARVVERIQQTREITKRRVLSAPRFECKPRVALETEDQEIVRRKQY